MDAPDAVASLLDALREEEPLVFFTAAVSSVKSDILELDAVYNGVLALSKNRKLAERNQILYEGCREAREGKFYFSLAQEEHFSEYLSNGRVNECIQQIDEILDFNLKNDVDNFHFQLLCTEIVNCGVRSLPNLNRDLPGELNVGGIYAELGRCWKAEQFRAICKSFIIATSERINSFEKSREYIVDYIKEYVENHYAEDIYLDLFAEKLHLSKVYISLHFKNKTGINFSDWLNDLRMKRAVEMLNGTAMKVQDIGRSVGCNTNTFIRSFKKYSGMTPSEYRQARLRDQ
jgi:two-component system, response regulator YesN